MTFALSASGWLRLLLPQTHIGTSTKTTTDKPRIHPATFCGTQAFPLSLPSPFPSPNCQVAARGPLWGEQLLRNLGKGGGRGGRGGGAGRPPSAKSSKPQNPHPLLESSQQPERPTASTCKRAPSNTDSLTSKEVLCLCCILQDRQRGDSNPCGQSPMDF